MLNLKTGKFEQIKHDCVILMWTRNAVHSWFSNISEVVVLWMPLDLLQDEKELSSLGISPNPRITHVMILECAFFSRTEIKCDWCRCKWHRVCYFHRCHRFDINTIHQGQSWITCLWSRVRTKIVATIFFVSKNVESTHKNVV